MREVTSKLACHVLESESLHLNRLFRVCLRMLFKNNILMLFNCHCDGCYSLLESDILTWSQVGKSTFNISLLSFADIIMSKLQIISGLECISPRTF